MNERNHCCKSDHFWGFFFFFFFLFFFFFPLRRQRIVRPGKPFLMANALAESLCQFAKQQASSSRAGGTRGTKPRKPPH